MEVLFKLIWRSIDTKQKAPAYIALGIPFVTYEKAIQWAKSVASILRRISSRVVGKSLSTETRSVQDIYEKNANLYLY